MVIRIRSECPICGTVHLDPSGATLVLDAATGESSQEFRCPCCSQLVQVAVTQATSEMLMMLGTCLAAAGGAD